MGRSREPPVFARFGRTNDEAKVAGGWRDTCQSGSPPGAGALTRARLNAEDDEDERELIPTGLSMSQIQLVHQLIIPKILDGAFSRDFTVLQ
jgi:hypothetical protein